MKIKTFTTAALWGALALLIPAASAQQNSDPKAGYNPKKSPPPESKADSQPPAAQKTFAYEQRPLSPPPPLVQPEQANAIIERFRAAYPEMGKPRFLIYVNRNLVDDTSGLKLIARTEKTTTGSGSRKNAKNADKKETVAQGQVVTSENRYGNEKKPELSLADRQTVRDIERLFGRPLRMASAKLVDQKVATDMIASGKFESLVLEGEQARKDRAVLSKHADVAIEILIASKEIKVPSFENEVVYAVPDIQATAIRLNDATILGQSSSADLIGVSPSAVSARHYGVQEISQATALALMEDMATGYPSPVAQPPPPTTP